MTPHAQRAGLTLADLVLFMLSLGVVLGLAMRIEEAPAKPHDDNDDDLSIYT